jgi:hypothetical protein
LALRLTTEELARHILKRVYEHTEGRQEWRKLKTNKATAVAVELAEDRRWLIVDESKGVYLTETGRALVRRGLS